jgi:hypothetical protein
MILAFLETARLDRENFLCWTRNRFIWVAGLIFFGAIISTSRAIFLSAAIIEILQQLYVITVFVSLVWIMVRRGKTNAVVQAFIWSGVFTASITVVDYYAGTRFGPVLSGTPNVQFWGRYAGTLGHPNKLGYYLVLTSVLSIAKFIEISLRSSQFWAKLLWGALLSIQMFGLYLSGSLTAYLGFSLSMIAFILAYGKTLAGRINSYSVSISLIACAVLLFGMIFDNVLLPTQATFHASLISTALNRVETETAFSRWSIFGQAMRRIGDNPVMGVGYDQIATSGIEMDLRQLDGAIHNALLQNWYVGGFFAFLGWVLIYVRFGWMAVTAMQFGKKRSIPPVLLGMAAATLSVILMDQFQDAVYQREKWLIFALVASSIWTKQESLEPIRSGH